MRWLVLALLGILVAAAVAIAASRLVSQQIGLASQPISAGDALAPATQRVPARKPKHRAAKRHQATAPSAAPAETTEPAPEYTEPTTPPTPSEPTPNDDGHDHGGGGEGADD